jgi:hypothetical protein
MLMDRIMGAFTFRKGIYGEVEKDETFTQTAWILVVVVAFLNALGANAGSGSIAGWLIGAVVTTIFALIGFALAAWVISFVGATLFKAQVNFGEMVRVLGLAYVWNVVGFIGIVALISSSLVCILSPITIIAAILGFIAWLVAAKEALDLDWLQTIITLIIGWIVNFIILAIAGFILGVLGLTAASLTGNLPGG